MRKKLLFGLLGMLCLAGHISAQVHVNEFMACNGSFVFDPGYNYSGWMEIYNPSDIPVDLNGYFFSDDENDTKKYKLSESRIIPAKGFGILWFNGEIKDAGGYEFKADGDGGVMIVSDATGNLIEKIEYPRQLTNISYGKLADGGEVWGYFQYATFNGSNAGAIAVTEQVKTPVLNVKSGFYASAQQVTITTATTGARIYYTTDGKEPDERSLLYTGDAITVGENYAIRVRAFADGMIPSVITTESYLINERRPGLPVVFLTTDPENLWNDTYGIYCVGTNGVEGAAGTEIANYNRDWARPAHMVFFDSADNSVALSQALDIEVSGNATRKFALKSLKLKASKKHENNRLNYSFFPDKNFRRFKSLVLRNGGNDFQHFHFRDAFQHLAVAGKLNLDYQAYKPSVLYLNGEYYGIMNIRERSNKDNVYTNLGKDEEDIYFVEQDWTMTGNTPAAIEDFKNLLDFVVKNDMSDSGKYKEAESRIDVGNFINYMAVQIYVNNLDWINNNFKVFRVIDGGKWRFILQDLDYGYEYDRREENLLQKLSEGNQPAAVLFNNLSKNSQFKKQFTDQYSIIMSTLFSLARVNQIIDNCADRLKTEYPFHSRKWGNSTFYEYIDARITGLKKYGESRPEIAFQQLAEYAGFKKTQLLTIESNIEKAGLKLNLLDLPVLPYNGRYFSTQVVRLDAVRYVDNYVFKQWEIYVNGKLDRVVDAMAFTQPMNRAYKFKAVYEPASQHRRDGLYINEISASNGIFVDNVFKKEDWIEIYNSSEKPVDLAGYCFSISEQQLPGYELPGGFPALTTVPAHGYAVVWASKTPSCGPLHLDFKLPKESTRLILSRMDGQNQPEVVDSLRYFVHDDFCTFGRYPDGSENLYVLSSPTIANTNQMSGYDSIAYTQPFTLVGDGSGIGQLVDGVSGIRVYPNPVAGERLYITLDEGFGKTALISIYTLTGSRLMSELLPDIASGVRVGSLVAGTYLIRIESDGHSYSKLFVKK